jgi:hypothetical protein
MTVVVDKVSVTLTRLSAIVHENRDDISAVSTFIIAVFTVILGTFTVRLAQSTKIAAEAAKTAAQAAVMVETPKLVLIHVALAPGWREESESLRAKLRNPTAFLTFKNYGRTPAFFCGDIFVGSSLPPTPQYHNVITLSRDETVEQGQEHKARDRARLPNPVASLTEEEINTIADGWGFLWVYGFVSYSDFLGQPHQLRFCRCLFGGGDDTEGDAWFIGDAPKAYTESF